MEYKKVKVGSYNLHMIRTNRFKTVNVQITFSNNIVKENITKNNFLADILAYSSRNYPTKKELAIALQNLYAVHINTSCYRLGNYYNTDINFYLLNEKYTEKGMYEESIKLLGDIINNPNMQNGSFDIVSFDIIRDNIKNQIESIKEDPKKYGIIKMLESMGINSPYAYHSYGYLEDLEKITPSNLTDYYHEFVNNSYVDVFVIGNIDFDETRLLFEKNFTLKSNEEPRIEAVYKHPMLRKKTEEIIELENIGQSKLSIGCKTAELGEYERNYCLTLYSIILGGGGDSLLFRNVREKHSLCYYISSTVNKLDNLLIICSGIKSSDYNKTIELIKTEISNIENGNFSNDDLEKAKMQYYSAMDEIYDYPTSIIGAYYASFLLGIEFPEERKKIIQQVKYEDIVNVSKKIHIDTIYLLKGNE